MKAALFAAVSAAVVVPSIASAAERSTQKKLNGATTHQRYIPTAAQNAFTGGRELSHTFSPFSKVVGSTVTNTNLTGSAPAGTYTGYTVSVDWSAIAGDPWSNEAIWAFTDGPDVPTSTTFYADPGVAGNAAANGSAVTLSWSSFFDVPWTNTGSDPFYMLQLQTFSGSTANWNNVSVTINDSVPATPGNTAVDLGGSYSDTLAAGEVKWYSFTYGGVGALSFDTNGSSLISPDPLDFADDTEIALYSSLGALIDTNDDIDFAGGVYTSELFFADGELPAGTYYLAVTGWPATFGGSFGAVSTSVHEGTLVINGIQIIPEPTTLGALALAGVILGRRRR
jgi:hypothetical protein